MAQRIDQIKVDGELWSQFTQEAKKSRKDPLRLLTQLIHDYIEQRGVERLNRESIKAVQGRVSEDDDIEGMIRDIRKNQSGKA